MGLLFYTNRVCDFQSRHSLQSAFSAARLHLMHAKSPCNSRSPPPTHRLSTILGRYHHKLKQQAYTVQTSSHGANFYQQNNSPGDDRYDSAILTTLGVFGVLELMHSSERSRMVASRLVAFGHSLFFYSFFPFSAMWSSHLGHKSLVVFAVDLVDEVETRE